MGIHNYEKLDLRASNEYERNILMDITEMSDGKLIQFIYTRFSKKYRLQVISVWTT